MVRRLTRVIDLDLKSYFDTVSHSILLRKVALRVQDDDVLRLLKLILKASGKKGVPQGGVISPLLANLYLNDVDRMYECFSYIRYWMERKVRRHLMRARGRQGFGWKRWSSAWIHETLGVFSDYRLVRLPEYESVYR